MTPKFDDLMDEYAALLSRVAASYEASLSLRQELYQEICIAVWQGVQRYKGDASIKTYILRIAHNRAITHVIKEAKTLKTHAQDSVEQSIIDESSAENNHDQMLIQNQQLSTLLIAIRALKLPARQVITLFMEGLTYQEISEVTGLNVSNVGVLITRTKQSLRRQLSHDE
ncbi:RNA polymerase sigma factor [Agaribacter marinus]|uniref:RNA polymerase sigma factor n=1 Tax=Agaribacter marinus TaxID=1431249 RepID=A0AA37SX55_9ALTE|nr:RNA polymerase sigma factor [Agaribacter marinus]GLR71307.1 RNA polymerase sigma factor [Agaribacter marinus]